MKSTNYIVSKTLLIVFLIFLSSCKKKELHFEGSFEKNTPLTLILEGPMITENGLINPFLDYSLNVKFTKGEQTFLVPGYYAADGNAAETEGNSGNIWKVHFLPNDTGTWSYEISFSQGKNIAVCTNTNNSTPLKYNGTTGRFMISERKTDSEKLFKKGRPVFNGNSYLEIENSKEIFIKTGVNSPENLLAYKDFDQTTPSHQYIPHIKDWKHKDPVWSNNKGKGIIGAINYLESKGVNSMYFLTLNILGDGDDVWPYTRRNERYRFDCSKMDQWNRVFSHMDKAGIIKHIVLQENENQTLLDSGFLDTQRKLYLRELIARFSHHPGLIWNLGEENGYIHWGPKAQTADDVKQMATYLKTTDPYNNPVIIHTLPTQAKRKKHLEDLLGFKHIDGISLQCLNYKTVYEDTRYWIKRSIEKNKRWVVFVDETGPPRFGIPPDSINPEHSEHRKNVLWPHFMAGGAGLEWYFGFLYENSDLTCENFRSRNNLWEMTKIARDFFQSFANTDGFTILNEKTSSEKDYCVKNSHGTLIIYMPKFENNFVTLNKGKVKISWFDPRTGYWSSENQILVNRDKQNVFIGKPDYSLNQDWVCVIEKLKY